jgi:mono/diheme cytochrome c family protein
MKVNIIGHVIDSFLACVPRSYGWNKIFCLTVILVFFNVDSVLAGGASVEDKDGAISAEEAAEILVSSESAAAGEGLFNQVCVYCHGAKGKGGKARKMQCRTYDSKYLYNTISNGKKRGAYVMPSWKMSFDEKTRWELTSYIMTLKDLDICQ